MQSITTITSLQSGLQSFPRSTTIGFVPTMGYLHEGHLSLVRQAKAQCDMVVMSIFVNPLQFLPHEDYERYPRNIERDRELAQTAGVDFLFVPTREEMYPRAMQTKVMVSGMTQFAEGASRPGHFDGVATVVMKLFQIVKPHRAYLGMKDAQQVAVIKQMVDDLHVPIEIVACPTYREPDGLAMSSRNVYLSEEERKQATVIYQAISLIEQYALQSHTLKTQEIIEIAANHIQSASHAEIDYIQVLGFPSFQPIQTDDEQCIVAIAVKFGKTRLIDNVLISLRGRFHA